ncbi:uncharacterized protein LOC143231432 [Tachypleus tridentatus]|uniref:uncharacterized protein LOC143231432 n=1 Tax=Tachypleus tridentatus TaxID=6853 RepID=UPI003FD56017
MNGYIDKLLLHLKQRSEYISRIDPLVIGTVVNEEKFRVTDVVVRGLSGIERRADVTLTNDEAKRVVLNANMGVDVVNVAGTYRYRHNRFIKLNGSFQARMNDIDVQIILSAPLDGGHVTLISAKVTKFGGFKITKVSGSSLFFRPDSKMCCQYNFTEIQR